MRQLDRRQDLHSREARIDRPTRHLKHAIDPTEQPLLEALSFVLNSGRMSDRKEGTRPEVHELKPREDDLKSELVVQRAEVLKSRAEDSRFTFAPRRRFVRVQRQF